MCRAHAAVRGVLGALAGAATDIAIADMEAGLEHLARGTPRHSETLLAVIEPYYRSLETGARVATLARELGIGRVLAVGNKVRTPEDHAAIEEFAAARGLSLAAMVPYDDGVVRADRQGGALLDQEPRSAAVTAIAALADRLAG